MAFDGRDPVRTKIVIDNKIIEQVNMFTYLGLKWMWYETLRTELCVFIVHIVKWKLRERNWLRTVLPLHIKHIWNINIIQRRDKKSLRALQRYWMQGSKKGAVQVGVHEKP